MYGVNSSVNNKERTAMTKNNEIPIYTLEDLSERLKISVRTLRKYIRRGELKAKKIGRTYYVTKTNLMSFFRPRKEKIEPIVTADELDNFQDELEFDEDSATGIRDEILKKRRSHRRSFQNRRNLKVFWSSVRKRAC